MGMRIHMYKQIHNTETSTDILLNNKRIYIDIMRKKAKGNYVLYKLVIYICMMMIHL